MQTSQKRRTIGVDHAFGADKTAVATVRRVDGCLVFDEISDLDDRLFALLDQMPRPHGLVVAQTRRKSWRAVIPIARPLKTDLRLVRFMRQTLRSAMLDAPWRCWPPHTVDTAAHLPIWKHNDPGTR